jgi:hypothetical protein
VVLLVHGSLQCHVAHVAGNTSPPAWPAPSGSPSWQQTCSILRPFQHLAQPEWEVEFISG